MKELPITMTGESVRAILAGTKTQTRRVIKPQPDKRCTSLWPILGLKLWWMYPRQSPAVCGFATTIGTVQPRYQIDDLLWVREAWRVAEIYNRNKPSELTRILLPHNIQYDANETPFLNSNAIGKPRNPMFLPKMFARIWLEVMDVRAERVQDIDDGDTIAEGVARSATLTPKDAYREVWDILNARRGYPWEANPWVWVYEFRRV